MISFNGLEHKLNKICLRLKIIEKNDDSIRLTIIEIVLLFFFFFQMDNSRCFEIHHVSSFEMYVSANKSKLKTCYPFLSAHQIKNKLKDAWKSLNDQQRKKYCKATVKVTPEKRVRKQRQKREKLIKKIKSTGREKKDELTRVADTPEYVNTMKLHDFREKHLVKYENDFDKDWPVFHSDLQRLDISYKTSQKSEHVPDVEGTPTKQHGILKLG